MIGYGFGPLLWAPVCEIRGRILATIIPYAAGAIFAFGTGASQGLAGIFINRFFTGFFCSPPVSNVGGVLADIWPDEQRGAAMAIWGMTVSSGPLLGDIVGGGVVNSSLS
jgi:MFS family permease